jgi:quercetin dioxygenase-like cupin family protein
MKRKSTVVMVAAALGLLCVLGSAHAQQKPAAKSAVVYASADKAAYKEVAPGISKSVLWGDHDKAAYGAYTRFAPGADAGMHTHSSDVWILVIKGAYVYKDEAGEKRVGPGDFIRIPAKHKHSSGGDKKEGALFYEESSGKFDLVPAK